MKVKMNSISQSQNLSKSESQSSFQGRSLRKQKKNTTILLSPRSNKYFQNPYTSVEIQKKFPQIQKLQSQNSQISDQFQNSNYSRKKTFIQREMSEKNKTKHVTFLNLNNNNNQQKMSFKITENQRVNCLNILKSLNYLMNPDHLKSQKYQQNRIKFWQTSQTFQTNIPTQLARNILEHRSRKQLPNYLSLLAKPSLKSIKFFKGNLSMIKNNKQTSRDYINKQNQGFTKMQLYQNESEQKININKLKYTNWLFDNNLEVIQAFQEKGEEIINAIYHTQSIDKSEFFLILQYANIQQDQSLYERLFWLFNLNKKSKTIDPFEMEYTLQIFRNSSLEENVGIFYDIGSRQNPGYINENELKSTLVSNLEKLDEQKTAKILSNELYQLIQPRNQAKGISKSELIYVAKIEPGIEHIIMKNTRTIKSGHSREYVTPKQYLVFEQAVKHEGIFFAEDKQLMSAINAKEQGYDVIKRVKNDLFAIKQMNKQEGIKFQQNSENSDDEDTEIDDENIKKQQKNKSQNN